MCPRPRVLVQNDKTTQETKKMAARYAVKILSICGVDTPNTESPESPPPNEAPSPDDFDS